MNIQDYLDFALANPVCFLATSENNQPHVRGMLLFFADESGFYFGTLSPKEMFKQLQKNPGIIEHGNDGSRTGVLHKFHVGGYAVVQGDIFPDQVEYPAVIKGFATVYGCGHSLLLFFSYLALTKNIVYK